MFPKSSALRFFVQHNFEHKFHKLHDIQQVVIQFFESNLELQKLCVLRLVRHLQSRNVFELGPLRVRR